MGKSMNWALDPRQPRKAVVSNNNRPQMGQQPKAENKTEE